MRPDAQPECICEFAGRCDGYGHLQCEGCGGDQCVCGPCFGNGEEECYGCEACARAEAEQNDESFE